MVPASNTRGLYLPLATYAGSSYAILYMFDLNICATLYGAVWTNSSFWAFLASAVRRQQCYPTLKNARYGGPAQRTCRADSVSLSGIQLSPSGWLYLHSGHTVDVREYVQGCVCSSLGLWWGLWNLSRWCVNWAGEDLSNWGVEIACHSLISFRCPPWRSHPKRYLSGSWVATAIEAPRSLFQRCWKLQRSQAWQSCHSPVGRRFSLLPIWKKQKLPARQLQWNHTTSV